MHSLFKRAHYFSGYPVPAPIDEGSTVFKMVYYSRKYGTPLHRIDTITYLLYLRFRPTRRPMPMPQPDYRIHEMNKRLQQRTDDSDNLWWDAFATEFFEDDANLTLTFCLEDGPKRYSKKTYLICRNTLRSSQYL